MYEEKHFIKTIHFSSDDGRKADVNIIADNSSATLIKTGKLFFVESPAAESTSHFLQGGNIPHAVPTEKLVYHPRGWLAGLVKGRLNYPR